MFWKYLPSSANIASDWLRAESSPVDEEDRKIKMDDGVDTSFASKEFTYLLTCGRCSLVSENQNDIAVS